MADRHAHITGSDLSAALAGANAPDRPMQGETVQYGENMIHVNPQGKVGRTLQFGLPPGETDGDRVRQANANNTILREHDRLVEAFESYHDEDGNIKPGYERQVAWSHTKLQSLHDAAALAGLMADQAAQAELAESLAKQGRAEVEASKVDEMNANAYATNHRVALTIKGQRR